MANDVFKRHELKYILTKSQFEDLKKIMKNHMEMDEYGENIINNVYFDTDDFLLIRRSLEKPMYKEKLRVRSYGETTEQSEVYIEIKKKYKGIVYKRRLETTEKEAVNYLINHKPLNDDSQIAKEIDYTMRHYENLKPMLFLQYKRTAYFGLEENEFRMTFDREIMANDEEVWFHSGENSTSILPDDNILLEVKTITGIPAWLLEFFKENEIYKASFSKYGTAYKDRILPKILGGKTHVS